MIKQKYSVNALYFCYTIDMFWNKREIKNSSANWAKYLPAIKNQKNGFFDSKGCTVFGTLNCLEALRNIDGSINVYSDRFTANVSGTDIKGNYPESVAESIAKYGLVDENELPFNDTVTNVKEFYSYNGKEQYLLSLGKDWANTHTFKYWNVSKNAASIKENLQYSPLGISVFAWSRNAEGLYIRPPVFKDNHFACLFGFVEGKYWLIYDSYDNNIKQLAWNYPFTKIFGYSIEDRKPGLLDKLFNFL